MNQRFAPHLSSMTWKGGLFIHWPFDPEQIRPHVPAPLELDTYNGRAWVTLLPFVLSDAGLRFSPSFTRMTFPELNFRTYVRFDDTSGLYFFSVDVGQRLVPFVVGGMSRLPCYYADMDVQMRGDQIDFRSVRKQKKEPSVRFTASYRPSGPVYRAEPGTLDYWLTERRRMYDPVGKDVLYAEIAHDPWPLQPADVTIRANSMFEKSSLPSPKDDSRVHYSDRRSITGSIPRWIHSLDGDPDVRPDRLARRGYFR